MRRIATMWLGLALLAGWGLPTSAWGVVSEEATTSRAAMQQAQRAIPFDKLSREVRAQIEPIVSRPSLYRRLPTKTVSCDPEMHVFLVRHPDVVVNIWELMGISRVQVDRTGPFQYTARDAAGTRTDLHIVYGTPELHVVYAEGAYEGPLFKNRITGSCVLLLRSKYHRDDQGRILVTNVMDAFVAIDNAGLDLVANTLQPLMGRTADFNFLESTSFVGRVSQAAEANGPGVQRMAERLTRVPPQTRQEFAEVVGNVSQRAAERQTQSPAPRQQILPATGLQPAPAERR